MKKLLLFVVIIFHLPLFAQNTFNVRFKNSQSQEAGNMAITADNGIIVCSYEPDSVYRSKLFLSKMDADGKHLWTKMISLPGNSLFTPAITNMSDSGFVAAVKLRDTLYNVSVLLFRCDKNGKIKWQKIIKLFLEGYEGVMDIRLCTFNNEDICMVNQTSSNDFFVYRISPQGDIRWRQYFEHYYYYSWGHKLLGIAATTEDKIAIIVSDVLCDYYCSYLNIFIFSGSGKPESRLYLDKEVFDYDFRPVEVMAGDDKGNIDLFLRGDFQNDENQIMYLNINLKNHRAEKVIISRDYTLSKSIFARQKFLKGKNLQSLQRKIFKPVNIDYGSPNGQTVNFFGFDDKWNIIKVTTLRENKISNIYTYKYDSLGRTCPYYFEPIILTDSYKANELFFRKYSFETSSLPEMVVSPVELIVDNQKGLMEICSGTYNQSGNSILAQTNTLNGAQIIPNPAHNNCVLKIHTAQSEHINIQISSLNGVMFKKLSYQTNAGANNININIADIADGVYSVTVISKTKTQTLKLIKSTN